MLAALFSRASKKFPKHKLKGVTSIIDDEFGEIKVVRSHTHYLRLRIEPNGKVSATIPHYATLIALKKLIEQSRKNLRANLARLPKVDIYTDEQIKQIRAKAKNFLPLRVEFLAKKHGFKYAKVSCRNQKTRWGSCSPQGNISLNIALVLLPADLIDYVILHELTHLKEMNHSQKFWQKLAENCPNYQKLRRDLKNYSPYLS
jgi:predicted metal-dependent hydrolase